MGPISIWSVSDTQRGAQEKRPKRWAPRLLEWGVHRPRNPGVSHGTYSPPEPPGGAKPANTWISDFWLWSCTGVSFLFYSTQFVPLCSDCARELTHRLSTGPPAVSRLIRACAVEDYNFLGFSVPPNPSFPTCHSLISFCVASFK